MRSVQLINISVSPVTLISSASGSLNRNGLGVGPLDRGRGRRITRQDNPRVRRLASATACRMQLEMQMQQQQSSHRSHNHQKPTTCDTGSTQPSIRFDAVTSRQCRPISALPSLSKAKQKDSEASQVSQVNPSQSKPIQSSPVVRSPSPLPTANPPESGCWPVYRIIPSSLPLVVQILPPLRSHLLCFTSRQAQLTPASLLSPIRRDRILASMPI